MIMPIDHLAHPDTDARLRDYFGAATETELLDALHCDFFYLPGRDIAQNEGALPFYKHREDLEMFANERVCPLGIRWQRGAYDSKFAVDESIRGPLEDPMISSREILNHPWPRSPRRSATSSLPARFSARIFQSKISSPCTERRKRLSGIETKNTKLRMACLN